LKQRSFSLSGFGKKRGIKRGFAKQKERLTASAALYGFIIRECFEQRITKLKTKCKQFMNKRAAPKGGPKFKKGK
jgi:hypothetical protein